LDDARRRWLRALVLVSVASLIPFAFVAVGPVATAGLAHGVTLPFALLAAAMALLIYTCTVLVLLTPGVPGCPERTRRASAPDAPRGPGGRVATAEATEDCLRLATRAQRELETGAFRDPDMSLQNLAEQLGVHPNRLSRAVNHVYGESFPCMLSRCRLDYFIRRVRTGCLDDCNILELAFDAGFSSKSTFNRVFKAQYGVAPSVFARGAAKRRAPRPGLPTAAAGLATRARPATMPAHGHRTNRSVQRHPDPPLARDARGHGRG
jgi:AraC-like DNA-binding protein